MDSSPPNDTLPVTDPAATNDAPRRSCTDRFAVVHEYNEAGTSRWAPWWLLLLTRLLSCGGLFGVAIYWVIQAPFFDMVHIYHFGIALSFFLLMVSTALHEKGLQKPAFQTATLLIHGIFAVLSLFTAASSILLLILGSTFYITGFIPFVLYIFDILVMQSRMRLRYRCAFIGWFISLVWDVIVMFSRGAGRTFQSSNAGWFALGHFILLFMSFPVIGITRIQWCCFKREQNQTS